MSSDPFHILGLPPASTPEEWKRAYRRLAMRWHPDRNTHPEATERFKQISGAYEQLLATVDPVEIEENTASTAESTTSTSESTMARAPDVHLNIEVTLEEGASGCRKTIRFFRGHPCAICHGSGEAGHSRTRFCTSCHGSGRIRDVERVLIPCHDCGGRGFFTERICSGCGGSGHDRAEVVLEISIPSGVLSGDELRLTGQGEPGDDSHLAGDLYLTVVLAKHPMYRLQGRDVHYRMPISALLLLAGAQIELPSPLGSLRYSLEAGATEAREIRLPGHGYPGRGKKSQGDLVVTLDAIFPTRLNSKQRRLLLKIHAELLIEGDEYLPALMTWRRANGLDES